MEIIIQALDLSIFGVGFVFTFLLVLVFAIKLMSKMANLIHSSKDAHNKLQINNISNEIDEETQFVISEAIKMHRGS